MWIWPSLCLWMPWPHEVPCHSWWQCWSPNWIYFCRGISMFMCSNKHWNIFIHVNLILTVLVDALAPWGAMSSMITMLVCWLNVVLSRYQNAHVLIVLSLVSVCSFALFNTEMSLLYMWIWFSLCSWIPWPLEVPCHPRWQCWSPNWIYFCRGISMLMCSGKHWNVSSIYGNFILTVFVDALAPWGAMSSTVTMLIS